MRDVDTSILDMSALTPQEIARETVKRLAARKLAPTPENFTTVYHEVAGTRPLKPFPLDHLRHIGAQLPEQTPAQQRFKAQFAKAVSMHSWDDVEKVLLPQLRAATAPPDRKETTAIALVEEHRFPADLREQLARIVTFAMPALGQDDARMLSLSEELTAYLRLETQHLPTLRKQMSDFAFRLSFVAEEQARIRDTLLGLLRSVFDNIRAINPENPWLQGQLEALIQATQPPLSMRRLEDVERKLRALIHRQIEAQEQTAAAQLVMKQSLNTFLQKLAQTSESSAEYQHRFEACAEELDRATSLADLAPVLQSAIQSARSLAEESRQTSQELGSLRNRAEAAEAEIQRLREALDRMSELASHDLLTGVLNRQGMADAIHKELSRSSRSGSTVCIALLDIDDFKRLNDRLGHVTGDAALQHLASVAKHSLRPQDSVARYGGEEFVVILPDTTSAEATEVLSRLQRELTKQIFLEGEAHVLITFSAGVVEVQPGETQEQIIQRADEAMYAAKRLGKNRVVAA